MTTCVSAQRLAETGAKHDQTGGILSLGSAGIYAFYCIVPKEPSGYKVIKGIKFFWCDVVLLIVVMLI